MIGLRLLIVVIWIAIAVLSRNTGSARNLDRTRLHAPASTVSDVPSTRESVRPVTDLYGNDIEDAVGDYRVDGRGDLYEEHSPDTEVARLPPPST